MSNKKKEEIVKKCRSCRKEIDLKAKKCPFCQEKQGNWMQRHLIITGIVGLIIISAITGDSATPSETASKTSNALKNNESTQNMATDSETDVLDETASQKNAVRKANSYLDISGFSRSGLIKQLEYEGFTNEDSIYAIDKIAPDWNKQAEKKAKSYLDTSGFSRSGLIRQLEYEGFTNEQANYGANAMKL